MTFTREAASTKETDAISGSFIPRTMSPLEMRARDLNNSRKLAKKAVAYRAAGNAKMADVCDERANAAFARATKTIPAA